MSLNIFLTDPLPQRAAHHKDTKRASTTHYFRRQHAILHPHSLDLRLPNPRRNRTKIHQPRHPTPFPLSYAQPGQRLRDNTAPVAMRDNHDLSLLSNEALHNASDVRSVILQRCGRQGVPFLRRGELDGEGGEVVGAQEGDDGRVDAVGGEGAWYDDESWLGG